MFDSIDYLQRLAISHLATRILVSGVQLGVYEAIGEEGKTAMEIAEATATSTRGVRMLLDCLVSFHLLKKSNQKYLLTPLSLRYLRRKSPEYMGHLWQNDSILEQWNHLNDAIRTGRPLRKKGTPAQEAASFASLARSLHVVNWKPAERAAPILIAGNNDAGMNVLDIACGSGVWGIVIAQADPHSRIVAHDFPEILEITKDYVNQHNVQEQFTYLPGDLRSVEFGEARFDLAILGNIIHSEGEHFSRELLKRVHRSLKEDGKIAIIDIIPDEERTGPQASMIMALAMLVETDEGDLFTLSEYARWLSDAGFVRIQTADIGSHSPMLIAHKV